MQPWLRPADSRGRGKIGVRAGKVLNKYKVGKHFDLTIQDGAFSISEERVAAEAAPGGLYVIHTFAAEADMNAEAAVLNYKRPAEVERAFRTFKGMDLQVRPIRHQRCFQPLDSAEGAFGYEGWKRMRGPGRLRNWL